MSDGKDFDTAELTITVEGVNDAPFLVDAIKTRKYIEDSGEAIVIDGSLDIRDADNTTAEGATVTILTSSSSEVSYVSTEDVLDYEDAFGITGLWDTITGSLTLSGSASIEDYKSALETVTYENTNTANPILGKRTIEWVVNDGDVDSTAIFSNIDVGGRNDSPTAVNDSASVDAGSTTTSVDFGNLLTNDTDPDEDNLSITSFRIGQEQESNPEFNAGSTLTGMYGQLTIEADGSYEYTANETAARKLFAGEIATETFTYTTSDGEDNDTGEIAFSITGINDSPEAIDDSIEVDEDSGKILENFEGILNNDADIDGDQLFIKEIRTGGKASNSGSSGSLSTELQGQYGKLVLNEDGSYFYTADLADHLDQGDIEVDLFTYTLTDLDKDDSAEIAIDVQGINDAPVLAEITSGLITAEDSTSKLTTSNLSGQLSATDADESASLTYGITTAELSTNAISLTNSQAQFNTSSTSTTYSGSYGALTINSSSGAYVYTPNQTAIHSLSAGQLANDSFNIYVSDGILTSLQTYSIDITGSQYSGDSSSETGSGGDTDSGVDTGSSSGSDSSSTSKGSSGNETTGTESDSKGATSSGWASSDFIETNFTDSEFVSDAISSLLKDPITGSEDVFNFWTPQQSLLVASTDLSGIQGTQIDDTRAGVRQQANTNSETSNNLFIESIAESDITKKYLKVGQKTTPIGFSKIYSNHDVRLQIPKSAAEILTSEQTLLGKKKGGIAEDNTNSDILDNLAWQQFVPAEKAGMIPLLISLKTRPSETMVVQLRTNTSSTPGSADLEFTPNNWDRNQLIWIDANQLEFHGSSKTLELKIGLLPINNPENIYIETLSITIQKPETCAEPRCGAATAQSKEANDDDDSNLDLELSSISEKRSAFYLLLRASLSPFIVLKKLADHALQQFQPDNSIEVARIQFRSIDPGKATRSKIKEVKTKNLQHFEPIDWNTAPTTDSPSQSHAIEPSVNNSRSATSCAHTDSLPLFDTQPPWL